MSIRQLDEWRRPGCGGACFPGRHDPDAHEAYGRRTREQTVLRTGPLEIDTRRTEVRVDGRVVLVTPTEWHMLTTLAQHADSTVTNRDVLLAVWGADFLVGSRRQSEGLLRTTMSRLRLRLGDAAALITTIPCIGYRLELVPPGTVPPPRVLRGGVTPVTTWSRVFDRCVCCGRIDRKHRAFGRCTGCYRMPSLSVRWPHYGPCGSPRGEDGAP